MMMVVQVLDVIVYDRQGRSWKNHPVRRPDWKQVESAIRRLDRFRHPFVILRLDEADHEGQSLEILGGERAYWLAASVEGYFQRRLYFPDKGSEEVRVWTSDQGFADEARFVTDDIGTALQAARYFFEHGSFDPSLPWEE
jgi:hypothetical protein